MGKMYKGDVTVWINVPDGNDQDPAQIIDGLLFATAQAAGITLRVGMFPENVRNLVPATIEESAEALRAEADRLGIEGDRRQRIEAAIDAGVEKYHAKQAEAQAATV